MRRHLAPILALLVLAAFPAAAHTKTALLHNGALPSSLATEPEIALPAIVTEAEDRLEIFVVNRKLASGIFCFVVEPNIWETHELGGKSWQGHDYMHARYYNPNFGRFLSVDPGKDWDPKAPQSWNSYAYVRNNPVIGVDPTGKWITIPNTPGASNVRDMLVKTVQRPSGRNALTILATKENFTVSFRHADHYTPQQLSFLDANRTGQLVKYAVATPLPLHSAPPFSGVDVRIDTMAVSILNNDPSGVTTTGHEVFHALGYASGNTIAEESQAGDVSGAAEAFGQAVLEETVDMTEDEAREYLRDLETNGAGVK
jgi:RHS repeat-associated protein